MVKAFLPPGAVEMLKRAAKDDEVKYYQRIFNLTTIIDYKYMIEEGKEEEGLDLVIFVFFSFSSVCAVGSRDGSGRRSITC
mmetsp:Transcript_24977/g.37525  ORF Transcript_24977/g.37525 Transcript_24977/m.37525 type:complete len:81 (+) Transcript_24977:733-975(+)